MSDKNAKGKAAKARKGSSEKSVLGNLPSTRPARMGRRRDSAPVTAASPPAETAKPKAARTTAAKTKTSAAKTTASKPKSKSEAAAAKLKASPAKPKAAARKPPAPAPAPRAAAGPRPVRAGSPSLPRSTPPQVPRRERAPGPPKGTELVTTAVQAAGELVQIGASLSARMVKRAVDRLPKP